MNPDFNLSSTGALLLIPASEKRAHQLVSRLTCALCPPLGAPFSVEIVGLISDALQFTLRRLEKPSDEAKAIVENAAQLKDLLKAAVRGKNMSSSFLSLHGKSSSHPLWCQLAHASARTHPSEVVLLYLGCSILLNLRKDAAPLPKVAALHLREIASFPLSAETLTSLLAGYSPTEHLSASWPTRLCKQWREVVKFFSGDDVPPPSTRDRITSQLLGAALNPDPAHVSGGQSHRQLSARQFREVCGKFEDLIERDELAGTIGVLVLRTGLAPDVLLQLAIQSSGDSPSGASLDARNGTVKMNLLPLVNEPAQTIPGAHPSGFDLHIHLPQNLAANLRKRSESIRLASTLGDLYPGATNIDALAYAVGGQDGNDEIQATWARLRNTLGPHLLRVGVNGLHAALLSLDFSLICRSKMHYAVVPAREWHGEEQALHIALGWDEPVSLSPVEIGIGSRVVPTDSTIKLHDAALLSNVESTRPGQRYSFEGLVSFHNQYTWLTAWRLSVLLALRASSRLALPASISTTDSWLAVHDKHTNNDRGLQPVPLCPFALETVRLYKQHCAALGDRLTRLGHAQRAQTRWCEAVAAGSNQRLLCTLDLQDGIKPVSSSDFTRSMDPAYQLPADPGRKIMENFLRWEGLPSSLVDQMLRHSQIGQVHLSNFNARPISQSMERLRAATQRFGERFFEGPTVGLRKG